MASERLRLGIVGCGAVVEQRHLPALVRRTDCEIVGLADPNRSQAEQMAAAFNVPRTCADYRELLSGSLDAAIVAVPNHLHAAVSVDLLARGIHVLVEKPMATSETDCRQMVDAAAAGRAVLALGMPRRFIPAARFVKWLVQTDMLGRIESVDVRDGYVFAWPLRSGFFFDPKMAGGGTLIDSGVHTLDELMWWFGEPRAFEYADDNFGGVEADCELRISFGSDVQGYVEFSRTRNLRNTAIVRGERGEAEVGLWKNTLVLRLSGAPVQIAGAGSSGHEPGDAMSNVDFIAGEHEDFIRAIRTQTAPEVTGEDGMRVVALVEACYRSRSVLKLPWLPRTSEAKAEVVR